MSDSRCKTYMQFLQAIANERCRNYSHVSENGYGLEKTRQTLTEPLYSRGECLDASREVLEQMEQCIKELGINGQKSHHR